MFFYVSLFIACVISTLVVLYLYHALTDAGKAVYGALILSSKDNVTRHRRNVRFNSAVSDIQIPWGWKGNDHEVREHGPRPATANGASCLDGFLNKHSNGTSSVGWPYREDKVEFAGTAHKVTRKTAPKKTRLRSNGKQPWGW